MVSPPSSPNATQFSMFERTPVWPIGAQGVMRLTSRRSVGRSSETRPNVRKLAHTRTYGRSLLVRVLRTLRIRAPRYPCPSSLNSVLETPYTQAHTRLAHVLSFPPRKLDDAVFLSALNVYYITAWPQRNFGDTFRPIYPSFRLRK